MAQVILPPNGGWALVIVMAAVFVTGAVTDSSAAAPPAGAPRGTLTVAQGIDADTLDPQVTSSSAVWSITLNIYDTLLARDRHGKLVPGLAVSWKSLNDTTWQIKLRDGVKFHNGEALDANAVKFSIMRALDPAVKSVFAVLARSQRSALVVGGAVRTCATTSCVVIPCIERKSARSCPESCS